ncbi:hypothetical protein [Phycicoccus flavus]|uniref:hypothetical protein n=1 Tax=Phycicoccus flavus TaxID=2502783 RepID=UPI000FEBE539|nr:hypothetical protein [Phycicoccus flavus]NHA67127.1 hypothetical protein [Phycicoccus flavus]
MDVVPAPLLPTPPAAVAHELHELLGPDLERRLRHLMDGRPVHAPGFLPGGAPVTDEERSPRVRFLAGPLHEDELTGTWYGPVLPDAAPWRATYLDPQRLAHLDCADCAGAWSAAGAVDDGFLVEEFEVMPGIGAMIGVPPAVPATATLSVDGAVPLSPVVPPVASGRHLRTA